MLYSSRDLIYRWVTTRGLEPRKNGSLKPPEDAVLSWLWSGRICGSTLCSGKQSCGNLRTYAALQPGIGQLPGEARGTTMYVSASDVPPPYGSAPDLDAGWSSNLVRIENFGAEFEFLASSASL